MTGKAPGTMIQDDTVTATQIAAGAVGSSEIADNSVTAADLAPDARPVFTRSFASGQQTIAQASLLTIPHLLTVAPLFVQVRAVCLTAELGYSVNDVVEVPVGGGGLAGSGFAVYSDATNVFVRQGSGTQPLALIHRTTGVLTAATNASWRLTVRAFA